MPDRFGNIKIDQPATTLKTKKPSRQKTQKPPAKRSKNASARKLYLFFALPAALYGFLQLFLYLYVPNYLTEHFPDRIAHFNNFNLSIEHADFNPFTFELHLRDLNLDDEEHFPVAHIKDISAKLAPLPLLRFDIVCKNIELQGVELNITRRKDHSYNISKILGTSTKTDSAPGNDLMRFSDLPFFFSLNNIQVRDSKITFADYPANKTHQIEHIILDFPTFGNIHYQTPYTVSPKFSALVNRSHIELESNSMSDSATTESRMALKLSSLQVADFLGYLPFDLPITPTEGTASGEVVIIVSNDKDSFGALNIEFDLHLTDCRFVNEEKKLNINGSKIDLNGSLSPADRTLVVNKIELSTPGIYSNNSQDLPDRIKSLFNEEENQADDGPQVQTPYSFVVKEAVVSDGEYYVSAGERAKDPQESWHDLDLSIKNYATYRNHEDQTTAFAIAATGSKKQEFFSCTGDVTNNRISGTLNVSSLRLSALAFMYSNVSSTAIAGNITGEIPFHYDRAQKDRSFTIESGKASIQDFSLTDKNGNKLQTEELELTNYSLADNRLNLGKAVIHQGKLTIDLSAPPFDIQLLSNREIGLQSLRFSGEGTLKRPVTNSSASRTIDLSYIKFAINDLDKVDPVKNNLILETKSSNEGIASLTGTLALAPLSWTGKIGFDNFSPKDLFGTIFDSGFLAGMKGKVAGEGMYFLPQKKFTGLLHIQDGAFDTSTCRTKWKDLRIADLDYTSSPFHLGINDATFSQPEINLHIGADSTYFLYDLLSYFPKNLPSLQYINRPETQKAISPLDIQRITFQNGAVKIEDDRYKPSLKLEVGVKNAIIADIHSNPQNAISAVDFTGALDNAPLKIEGKLPFLSPDSDGSFTLALKDLPITTFSGQLDSLPEIKDTSGTIDLTFEGRYSGGNYIQQADISLLQLKTQNLDSDLTLAIALQSSKSNSLDFHIERISPVEQTVPTLFESVLSELETDTVKAAVSPLLLATGDFTDLISNEVVEFEPGEFIISPKGREVINRYAALLIEHPRIGLRLSGGLNMKKDREALASRLQEAELKRVEAENEKRFLLWQQKKAEFEKRIIERQQAKGKEAGNFTEEDIPEDILLDFQPLKPVAITIDDEMLQELAVRRKEILREQFTTQLTLQSEKIIIDSEPIREDTQQAEGELTGVGVELRVTE